MATVTATYPAPNASVIYAKPLPLTTADWAADVVAFTAITTLDAHSGTVADDASYFVFVRAGASPAASDSIDGAIGKAIVDADVLRVLSETADINTDVAKETKQDSILAQIQGGNVVQVPSPNVEGSLVLVQGDTYDGIANPKPSWTVSTDYTDGWTVTLTIRDEADAVVATHTGSVDSATLITVAMTAPTGLPMEGCPGRWQGKFDVQLSKGSSRKTIALDKCYVSEDQTRD